MATKQNLSSMENVFAHVKSHEWRKLIEYTDFEGTENDLVVYAITGPHSGGMVVVILDYFDLYQPEELCVQEQLTQQELGDLVQAVPQAKFKAF